MNIAKNSLYYEWHVHGYFLYGFDLDTEEVIEICELGAMAVDELPLLPADQWELAEAYSFEMDEISREEWLFSRLPDEVQDNLEDWYNVRRDDWEDEDYARLRGLYEQGRFRAWRCTCRCGCAKRVFWGDLEDWAHFQGVLQADYCSYPAESDAALRWCDACRCRHQDYIK